MEVEGDDQGEVRPQEAPHFLQQEPLRVEVAGGPHGAVKDEVETVGAVAALLHGLDELRGQPLEALLQ